MTQDGKWMKGCMEDAAGEAMKHGVLRDYQQEMLDRLHEAWRNCRSVMVQMPTGTGKTVLMAEVIRGELEAEDGRQESGGSVRSPVLIVAHRRELIEQIKGTIDSFGIDRRKARVYVESIQSLSRHIGEADYEPHLIIIDEAHHALAETYRMLWERWPEARFLGLTATPCRLSGEPFTDLFDTLVQSWTLVEFIRKGWLSDLDYVSVRRDSAAMRKVAGLDRRGADGDFQRKQMALVLDTPESVGHLYRSYRKYADGKKGIVYAISQAHARHIADYYQAHGVNCCMIDAKTPAGRRKQWVEDYRRGRIDVLVNVDIFSSGFDCPEVEFIQLARPTLSLSLYLQQIGRGMRVSGGKSQVTVLDQVGSWLVFGLPTSDWDWKEMFEGRLAGKGRLDNSAQGLSRAGEEERMLVNEDMYRIQTLLSEIGDPGRRRPPKQEARTYGPHRLEVFKELGRYGIRREGEACLPAIYQRLEELPANDRFFVLALLPRERTGGAERWTVIDMEGRDMNASMAGTYVGETDGVFEFRVKENGRFVTCLHDVDYGVAYTGTRIEKTGGLLFFRPAGDGECILRGQPDYRMRLGRGDVVYNDSLTMIGSDLFVRTDNNRRYEIAGYRGDKVIVRDVDGLAEIGRDGRRGRTFRRMPGDATAQPDFLQLGLQRETAMSALAGPEADSLLRDYQREMLGQLRNSWRRHRSVLLQTPTGTGKAWMAVPVIREEIQKSNYWLNGYTNKVLVVSHREPLTGQVAETLECCGVKPRLLTAGFHANWTRADVTVGSADYIGKHLDDVDRDYVPSLIVIDEAHLIPLRIYHALSEKWPYAKWMGLTATPMGEDGLTLKRVFGQFVASWSLRRLIGEGWLKDIAYVDGGVATTAEVEPLYQAYHQYAEGRRGIVCAKDERHAKRIAECYRTHGVRAEICRDLNTLEGRQQVENLRNGNLRVLVEVEQFSGGFRCPDIDFVQLTCPASSLNTYLHQVGCGMRIEKSHDRLIVIDHVGARERYGLPTDERDWSRLFNGLQERKDTQRKTQRPRKTEKTPAKMPATTKWQMRMQRLLGDVPGGQMTQRKI